MNQDEFNRKLDTEAPEVVAYLETLTKSVWKDYLKESIIYGVAQGLSDAIGSLELPDEDKGRILSIIITNLCEFNRESLALFNHSKSAILDTLDGKSITVH